MSSRKYYILKGHKLIETDLVTWETWIEKLKNRRVVLDDFGRKGDVSTVFLGLDHSFSSESGHVPLLFETMVFGGLLDGEQEHYATWDEAMAGHIKMCDRVKGQSWLKSLLRGRCKKGKLPNIPARSNVDDVCSIAAAVQRRFPNMHVKRITIRGTF